MRHAMSFPGKFLVGVAAVAVLCACLVLNAEEPEVAASAPPTARKWFVEAGPFWRAGGDVDVRINSLPAIPYSRPTVAARSTVGPPDRVADRQYDDGYVRMDYGTGVWDNNTWYWGYNNSSQALDSQLVFGGIEILIGNVEYFGRVHSLRLSLITVWSRRSFRRHPAL